MNFLASKRAMNKSQLESKEERDSISLIPVVNSTGIRLDTTDVADVISIIDPQGRPATKGTGFRSRLLDATAITTPVHSNASTGRRDIGASQFANTLSSFTVSSTRIDDPASSSGQLKRSSLPLKQSVMLADKSSTSVDSSANKTHMEVFFERMDRELHALRQFSAADHIHQATQKRQQLGNSGSTSKASYYGGATSSSNNSKANALLDSSASLNPWIRVDHRRRPHVDECFGKLQNPTLRDTVREDVFKHLDARERKYISNVSLIADPAKALLETLWEQHRVLQPVRARFAEKFFSPDRKNYEMICKEILRFRSVPPTEVNLIRLIGLRETHVESLKRLLQSPLLASEPDPSCIARVQGLSMDILNCIILLRHVTCLIVDGVQTMRDEEDTRERHRQGPVALLWNGKNFLIEIRHELDFLAHTKLAMLLGQAYSFESNPLLLPRELHEKSTWVSKQLESHEMILTDALRVGEKDTVQSDSLHSTKPPAVQSSAVDAKFRDHQATHMIPVGVDVSTLSSNASNDLFHATASLNGSMQSHQSTVARPLSEQGSRRVATPQPSSSNGNSREKYFAQLDKQALLDRRLPMDRTNVYRYPAHIYREERKSLWKYFGTILQRSIDPRIPVEPYNENIEFEHMQYGRLTCPPSLASPWVDPVFDAVHKCFRTVLADVPVYSYNELVRREILIFAEEAIVKSRGAKQKFHRAIDKLRMTYRGFVSVMQQRRITLTPGHATKEYLLWVRTHAPEWLEEAKESLCGDEDDDEAIRNLLL